MADWIEQLERLAQLHRAGALTDAEFAAQKAKLLADQQAAAAAPPPLPAPVPPPMPAPAAAPGWDSAAYPPPPRGGWPRWLLIGVPTALVLAGAAWFGASILGSRSDPELSGLAMATPSAEASDAALPSAAPSTEAPLPAALDGTLAFAGASECKAAGTLEAIYKKLGSAADLGSGKGITVRLDAFTDPLAIEVKNQTDPDGVETRHAWLRFPANTTWHGLKLSRVTSTSVIVPEADGSYTRTVNFAEQPDKVRTTLARLGFGAPRAPDYAELHDEGCGGSMQVVAVTGGSALRCSWGC